MATPTWDDLYGEGAKTDKAPKSAPDLSAIDSMDADSLRKLIRTTAGAFWGYALTDRKEIAEAMKLRLAHIGLTADVKDALVAIERWLDREEGKPNQSVQLDASIRQITVNASIEILQSSDIKTIEHEE